MANVSNLQVTISAKDRTKRAFSSVTGAMKKMKGAAFAATAAVAAIGAGLIAVIKKTVDFADKIGKTADMIGITTTELQKLRFAFDIGGMSAEATDKALVKFTRNIGDLEIKTGELYSRLIALKDKAFSGILKSSVSLTAKLKAVFDKMKSVGSVSLSAAIGVAAFGRQGAALAAIARKGGVEFGKWVKRAEELGLILSEKMVRDAEDLKDAFTVLEYQIRTAFMKAVLNYGPQLKEMLSGLIEIVFKVTQAVVRLSKKWGLIELGISDFEEQHKKRKKEIDKLQSDLNRILAIRKRFRDERRRVANPRHSKAVVEARQNAIAALKKENEELQKRINLIKQIGKTGKDGGKKQGIKPAPIIRTMEMKDLDKLLKKWIKEQEREENAIKKATAAFHAKTAAMKQQRDLLRWVAKSQHKSTEEIERHLEVWGRQAKLEKIITDAKAKGVIVTKAMREELFRLSFQTEFFTEVLENQKKAFEASKGPIKEYLDSTKSLRHSMEEVAVSGAAKLTDSLVAIINGTKNAKDAFKNFAFSIIEQMQKIIIQKYIMDKVLGIISGMIAPATVGHPSGGQALKKQYGGPVKANTPYLVGEAGPELFMSSKSGRVVPNHQMGGGVNVVNNYDFSGANPATIQALRQESERIKQETFASVFTAIDRGGSFARVSGRR